MAASTSNPLNRSPNSQGQIPRGDIGKFDLNIIAGIIGEDKRLRSNLPAVGIPQSTQTKEELFVHSIFESCLFKSTASCVMGKIFEKEQKLLCMVITISVFHVVVSHQNISVSYSHSQTRQTAQ